MDVSCQTAFDPSAPRDERVAAHHELAQGCAPLASELAPAGDVRQVIDWISRQYEEAAMMKAASSLSATREPRARGPQSVMLDDFQIFAHGDYWEKPSQIGFDGLRQMVEQTPILNAILVTRLRQVSRFCAPQEDDGLGFSIRHVDRAHKLTQEEEESAKLLMRFISNCGWEFNPRRRKMLGRDTFGQFMAKSVRDSLTMDSAPIETELKRDRRLGMDGFYAVDGATVRLCSDEGYRGDDRIFALQAVQGRIVTPYTHADLIYEVRNPRTDVRLSGYGLAEPELLIRVVTGFLNAMTYNSKGFDENAIPHGLLTVFGDYDSNDLAAFKRYWNAMVQGVNNRWKLPVLSSKDKESGAQFTPFNVQFNEMHFAKWMTFLASIACAIYSIDPTEVNFESFTSGRAPLSGSDTEQRLAASQDKGLRPLLAYYEQVISDYIIADFSDKFVFRWTGLDDEDLEKRHELKKLTCTVDEVRAEEGRKPLGGAVGSAPLNPALLGVYQQERGMGSPSDGTPDAAGGAAAEGEPEEAGGDLRPFRAVPRNGRPSASGHEEDGAGRGRGQEGDGRIQKSYTVYRIEV